MVCKNCGTQLPDGSVFCQNCGANLTQQAQQPQQQPQQQQYQQPQYQAPVKPVVNMPKAKLGMAVGLLAALTCFLGMFSTLGAILAAGYILVKEDDSWLRKVAVRVLGVLVCFGILSGLVNVGFDFFRTIRSFGVANMSNLFNFESFVYYVLDGIQAIFLFIMGIKAFSYKAVRFPVVDGWIDRYVK